MGISRYNASGYLDMTAHIAIRNVEEDNKWFHIGYPTGHMDVRLENYFPGNMKRVEKLFRLVRDFSTVADKDRLLAFLKSKEQRLSGKASSLQGKLAGCKDKKQQKTIEAELKEAERSLAQIQRNIQQFEAVVLQRNKGVSA